MEQTKPTNLCEFEGCQNQKKHSKRKYCSRKCHEKAIGSKIPTCHNADCGKRVRRGRNLYCSWTCYKIDTNKNAHNSCQRTGCENPLTSRKASRKYCSQTCYKLDAPNRPSRKVIRICVLPECGKQIKRRGTNHKYCSVECSVKSRKKLIPVCCPTCQIDFQPKRTTQTFCSQKCKLGGDKEFTIKKLSNLPRRFSRIESSTNSTHKWMLTSNLTWQNINGEIPPNMDIWFLDDNIFNDMDISNLYLVSHKEYLKLIRKVTQSVDESTDEIFQDGNYEGRAQNNNEPKYTKEELYNPNTEVF